MPAGILPENEEPYSTSVNDSTHAADMKGNSGRPTPKYTKVGERLRHVIPGHMACSLACGGRACKYESPARWGEQEQAINGVYSSWVTENILAMARPSTELLEKYRLIEQFHSHGIKTVINLQRPGEHASCGNPLEQESGFTYLPEAFMEAGIYFYNFGWKDYGVASLTTILDMVKVMTFALQEGKVAVHCHAGLGRTGVLIACYLVFATRMTADQAIIFVRAKRPNSIQTRGQLLCVREFTQFLIPLRNIFSCCDPKAHAVTLAQYLIRQRHLLHGYEARLLKHVPKIIHLVCKLLLDLAENRPVVTEEVAEVPSLSAEIEKTVSEMITLQLDKELLRQGSDASDSYPPTAVPTDFENQDVILSSEQEIDPLWKRRNVECLQPLTHLKRPFSYSDSDLKRAESLLEQGGSPWTGPAQVLLGHHPGQQKPISHCYTPQSPQLDPSKEKLVQNTFSFWNQAKFGGLEGLKDEGSPVFHRETIAKEVQRSRTFSSGVSSSYNPREPVMPNLADTPTEPNCSPQQAPRCQDGTPAGCCSDTPRGPVDCGFSPKAPFSGGRIRAQDSKDLSALAPHTALQSELSVEARRILAAKALASLNEFTEEEEVKRKVEMWQKELNSRDGAWERICGERDPFVLCSLMWSWVEQLKEPVVTKEDVDTLAGSHAHATEALFLLEKGQHQTILCVLHCIVSLQAIPADVEEAILIRAIKAFTKQVNFDSENGPLVYDTLKKIFKHTLEENRKMTKDGPQPGV
ncbi:protein tyrosine phosphatase domain-containing protein 1 isoform X1 [Mirounga leonina]|uniref:protein tyrosine phosphatase domain-containing protein 1 isoform X1 n=1 Tax=Mirounga leonina TaxID=9715 RepID=UPI00156C2932|nr:protein tyrosine phosphatase domain-containing protein 1 isoform X1 [Mirounga leonina]XP_034885118.1 protein tyrosine phosphatase domain-containing protein 1 isoform X1 [Mirounga leonina]XP_034885119.1 protein tyrosine phosphatase domain-containing protein 1 isoform X1 [Mirounga leonina]XP_034885120.1 protein tyrosine phosphatase domain-containing protein 1 isoform X1 [Mirounga leonina]XP_034885121.1 protein tyrosine phosphatase domain-containing protein 1 isoform X1 [Mirounga leonina]